MNTVCRSAGACSHGVSLKNSAKEKDFEHVSGKPACEDNYKRLPQPQFDHMSLVVKDQTHLQRIETPCCTMTPSYANSPQKK